MSRDIDIEHTRTLKADRYLARLEYESDNAPQDRDFEVIAGERTEITINPE